MVLYPYIEIDLIRRSVLVGHYTAVLCRFRYNRGQRVCVLSVQQSPVPVFLIPDIPLVCDAVQLIAADADPEDRSFPRRYTIDCCVIILFCSEVVVFTDVDIEPSSVFLIIKLRCKIIGLSGCHQVTNLEVAAAWAFVVFFQHLSVGIIDIAISIHIAGRAERIAGRLVRCETEV